MRQVRGDGSARHRKLGRTAFDFFFLLELKNLNMGLCQIQRQPPAYRKTGEVTLGKKWLMHSRYSKTNYKIHGFPRVSSPMMWARNAR